MKFKETEVGKIPEDWEIDELLNQVDITMGQSPKSEFYNNEGEGTPFMQGRTTFGDKYHEISTWCTDPKRVASKGDILMSVRAPVGDVNIATMDLCIGRGLSGLKMKNGNNEYLYYLLKNYIGVISNKGTGTVFESINKKGVETLRLPFAPPKEQKAIANILSTLDEKIEINNKINKNLESIAQEIFKHWFVDFEFLDEDGNPYKSSGGDMVESEMGMIPEGWEVGPFSDLVNIKYGKDHKKLSEGDIPVYGSGGVMRYVNKALYTLETVLIPRKGTLNNVLYLNKPFWSVDTMFYTEMIYPNIAKYIYCYMKMKDLLSMNNGSAVPSMTTTILNKFLIIKSPIETIKLFNNLVTPLFLEMDSNINENKLIVNIRDTLIQKLMSGEIRIPLE